VNAISQAKAAYRAQARTIRTERGLEYDALARITHRLKLAAEEAGSIGPLASAVHDNRRLWTIFATEAADRANPLPGELRARIISLAEFTRQHSGRVLRDGADVAPLVDVNLAIMRGLNGDGGAA
jgi:flagellar protein FlaF